MKKKRRFVLLGIGLVLLLITTWNLCVLFLLPAQIQLHSIDGRTVETHTKHFLFSIYEARHFTDGVYEKKQVTFTLGPRDFVWLYDKDNQFVDYFSYS